jgi:hypothetical protein
MVLTIANYQAIAGVRLASTRKIANFDEWWTQFFKGVAYTN